MKEFIKDTFLFIWNSRPWKISSNIKNNKEELNNIFKINSNILNLKIYILFNLIVIVILSFMLKSIKENILHVVVISCVTILSLIILFLSFAVQKYMIDLNTRFLSRLAIDKDYLLDVIEYKKMIYSALSVSCVTVLACIVKVYYGEYLMFRSMDIFTVGGLITSMLYFVSIDSVFEKLCVNYYFDDYIKYFKTLNKEFSVGSLNKNISEKN